MNIKLTKNAITLINDLCDTGLWGATPEDTARRIIEEKLRELCPPPLRKKRVPLMHCGPMPHLDRLTT